MGFFNMEKKRMIRSILPNSLSFIRWTPKKRQLSAAVKYQIIYHLLPSYQTKKKITHVHTESIGRRNEYIQICCWKGWKTVWETEKMLETSKIQLTGKQCFFQQCFQKPFFFRVVKCWDCVEKNKRLD